ncbi:MAG TPA: hypothetical protein PK307_06885 [Spirochaetota bacterium]|nr:hypothetical protein [Spirochaetota bacterium]HPN12794.1 hypothetical protein [Spirochaetota bacterium]HQL81908.1 hypothetical protein [Spirochaetota bacterium]
MATASAAIRPGPAPHGAVPTVNTYTGNQALSILSRARRERRG